MTKNYQYLIDVYKATLDDSKLYINTRSSHWDEWYEKNKKFFKLENLINFILIFSLNFLVVILFI